MANPFDEIDPRSGAKQTTSLSASPASTNPFDEIDPRGGTKKEEAPPPDNSGGMQVSEPDASGRRFAEPAPRASKPAERGIIARAREGAGAPMQGELGFSKENLDRAPALKWLQPHARAFDVAARTPASIYGGFAGAVAGLAEKAIGPAQADRLQRDLGVLPMAVAPEVPIASGEAAALRGPKPELRPPPVPPRAPPPLPPEVSAIPRQVERPDVGVGLLRPDVPHELPGAQSRGLSAAGNGGPLTGMQPETIAHMRQVMEEQGFNQNTIDQRLSEMSAHHFFGEITPSLEADMGAVASPPGPGKLEVMGSVRQRALEARERTQHVFNRGFGENENLPQMKRIMEIERNREADPLYQRFRETAITPTPEIDALLPRLEAAGVLQDANRALRIEGEPTARGFNIPGEPPTIKNVPTAGAFQLALEQISDRVGVAMRAGEPNVARRYTRLRNDLLAALDNHPSVGETWRQAREAYSRPAAIQDAIELGRTVMTNSVSADELPFMTAGYNATLMRGLRVGIRDYYEQMLGKRGSLTQEVLNNALSPNNVQKMRWAIGDAATDEFVAAMEHEQHMHGAPTRIHGGSPTALRLEANKRWTAQPGVGSNVGLGDVLHAVEAPVSTSLKAAGKAAVTFGLSARRAAQEARMARLREEASRIFTLQGPERDAVARHLVGGVGAQPYRHGGRVAPRERRSKLATGGAARSGLAPRAFAEGGAPEMSDEDQAAMSPETFVNPAVKGMIEGAGRFIAGPGKLARPNPHPPGSEVADWYEDQREKGMLSWSRGAALATMGTGAIAGVPVKGADVVLGSGPIRRKGGTDVLEPAAAETPRDVGPAVGGSPGGGEGLRAAELQAERWAGERTPLEGLPRDPQVVDGDLFVPGPVARAHDVAERYMADKDFGLPHPDRFHPIDKEHAKAIAQAFEDMKHAPNDPKVKAAYEALAQETKAQYEAIVEHGGLKVTPVNAADYPYHGNPRAVVKDVADNNHMAFFKSNEGFGSTPIDHLDQPMLRSSGIKVGDHDMLYNDLFRVVHDYFGHVKNGNGFRGAGEDNAWRAHAAMYSPEARGAMTTETRGQNSWLNYGPHGEHNKTANAADTIYAQQKVGLLPDWVMQDRVTAPAIRKTGLADEGGLALRSKDYTKASRGALDEIAAGPKGAGPLGLSSANGIPDVPQVPMDRYVPPRGVSPRMQDALDNPKVARGVAKSIEAGRALGADKWYHNEPIRRAFVEELGPIEGQKAFSTYMDMVSATSPRSDASANIRNASYYYQHARAGKELPEKLPFPYGHMAQALHRSNYEGLVAPRAGNLSAGAPEATSAWDIYKNPKPASFSQNLQGNLAPGTIDTHAFRNIAMRTGDPRFLETSLQEKMKEGRNYGDSSLVRRFGEQRGDITTFRPQQLVKEGRLSLKEAQDIPSFWAARPKDNEYAAAEALYRKLGAKAGLPTADAQAAAWSGAGQMTGLASPASHTFSQLFNERVLYTSKMRGENPQQTLKDFITGKKPLLSIAGAAAAGSVLAGQHDEKFAEGGAVGDDYNTVAPNEAAFQTWKALNAPGDSGVDYDLRGAYLADMQRAENGHMGDRFKKPNHPTFSDQSQYAVGDQRGRAGTWAGETFVPPAPRAFGGRVRKKK